MTAAKEPYFKLKGYFVEHGVKLSDIADDLGISYSSLSKKINRGEQDFTLEQVRYICDKYQLDPIEYFNLRQ